MRVIMGIQVGDREQEAVKVQELLTKHGCIIKTRLGLHEASVEGQCSSNGLIILEFIQNKEDEIKAMITELSALESIKVEQMIF
ncbi:hypothetical protein [Fusibacter ferrireducens]|uniref:Iron-only hydrogenase system regulator n=1 Tax=Fusibacter ferrireducens TaxID=2785058 RepID=A0ABR9ZPG8_9FIRM|nr:hypothetical protein [Fusibacter ferrireducens]MBF4692357.1 hypothetical protein [Fusibacter ferrireducens]